MLVNKKVELNLISVYFNSENMWNNEIKKMLQN